MSEYVISTIVAGTLAFTLVTLLLVAGFLAWLFTRRDGPRSHPGRIKVK